MRDRVARGGLIFYLTLLLLTLCALVALFFGMQHLRSRLAHYENLQPRGVSEEVFESLFKPGNANELIEKCGLTQSRYDKPDALASVLNKFLSAPLTCHCTARSDDTVSYRVDSGDALFAEYTLVPAPQGSKQFWMLGALTLHYESNFQLSLEIPQGMKAFCNGVELADDRITSERLTVSGAHMPPESTLRGLVYVTYTVDGLLAEPVVTVQDAGGAPMQVEVQAQTGLLYVTAPTVDGAMREPYEEQALEAAEALSIYALGDSSTAYPRKFLLPGCALDENIENTKLEDVPYHNGYEFENEKTEAYRAYSDDTFSCRVQYDQVLQKVRDPDAEPVYHYDLICYFTLHEGTAVIYDLVVYGEGADPGETTEEGGTATP